MAARSRRLPVVIDIPEPCAESWDGMLGSERERRCARCEKQILNLSALSHAEIAQLMSREGVCVTLEVNRAGELVTTEPASGARGTARKVVLAAALSALAACGGEHAASSDHHALDTAPSASASSAAIASITVTPTIVAPPAASSTDTSTRKSPKLPPPERFRTAGKPLPSSASPNDIPARKIGMFRRVDPRE